MGGDGGCRVSEVRAGTTSPMPDHRGFKLQELVNFQKFSTLRVNLQSGACIILFFIMCFSLFNVFFSSIYFTSIGVQDEASMNSSRWSTFVGT